MIVVLALGLRTTFMRSVMTFWNTRCLYLQGDKLGCDNVGTEFGPREARWEGVYWCSFRAYRDSGQWITDSGQFAVQGGQ
jgi:hypothetical protein